MSKGIDFIHDFDPYDENHIDTFMYFKNTGKLPENHCFKEVKAKDEIVLQLISNKIVHAWGRELNKRDENTFMFKGMKLRNCYMYPKSDEYSCSIQ